MSFNFDCDVVGRALPDTLGDPADSTLDWQVSVDTYTIMKINNKNPEMVLPGGVEYWPSSNSAWGEGTLLATIDEGCYTDQDDELITGSASYIDTSVTVYKYYRGPGRQRDPVDPNWFIYYKDNAGGGTYTYGNYDGRSGCVPGGGESTIRIWDEAYNGQRYLTFDHGNPGGRLRITGWSAVIKYYPTFIGVLEHERQHANYEVPGDPTDLDLPPPLGDNLPSAYETGTSKTDPTLRFSAHATIQDNEAYAGGPVEKEAIETSVPGNDWAQYGYNWD